MIEYIIKSAICSSVLYLGYILIYRKSRNYHLNRIILLFSVFFSLTVPLLNISLNEPQVKEIANNNYFNIVVSGVNEVSNQAIEGSSGLVNNLNISLFFILIYSIIVVLLLGRFCLNLYSLMSGSNISERALYNGKTIALLNKKVSPFSFLQTIFISKDSYINDEIDHDFILHETAHANQLHSMDILFIELIQIFYWFNPFIYQFKKLIKINHEYLADEYVIKSGSDKIEYSNKLLNYTFRNKTLNLASGFNYSLIKNRLIMLSKFEQKRRITNHLILFVPIIAILFIATAFSSPAYANSTKQSQKPGIFYADTLFWSGENHEVYLKGKVKVKHGTNDFNGNGSFSFLGKVNLLIINGTQATLNSSIKLSGTKCEIITLSEEEAHKKYGTEGKNGAVEIKTLE